MGLFDYLKNKFKSHKKEEKQEEKPVEASPVQEEPLVSEEIKPQEEVKEPVKEEVKEEPKVEEKPIEEPKDEPVKEEVIPEEPTPSKQEEKEEEKKEETKKAYVKGMKKANHGFMYRLKSLTSIFHKVNEEYFDDLEEILIESDVGAELSIKIIDEAKKEAKVYKIDKPEEINKLVVEKMFEGYSASGETVSPDIRFVSSGPTVLLVVGVNGGGKTTTIAKLAYRYKAMGKKVLLVAADTFRAGAVEQLGVWSKRIGVDIVSGADGCDPSSLCYDGLTKAKNDNYDLVIVDTAGRLQNKANLMAELSKMKRVMSKVIPDAPHESFLVIDANTGQNGVEQAKVFKETTSLSGIVITKMDGTSKGGIILSIRDQLGIPVRFIGLGEGMTDLKEFDLDGYLYGLLIGEDE